MFTNCCRPRHEFLCILGCIFVLGTAISTVLGGENGHVMGQNIEDVRNLLSQKDFKSAKLQILSNRVSATSHIPEIIRNPGSKTELLRSLVVARELKLAGDDLLPLLRGLVLDKDAQVRTEATRTLGAVGTQDDAAMLVERLGNEEDEGARISIVRSLGTIGNAETATKLRVVLEKRKARLSVDQQREDYTFREAEKTLVQIEERVRQQQAQIQEKTVEPDEKK